MNLITIDGLLKYAPKVLGKPLSIRFEAICKALEFDGGVENIRRVLMGKTQNQQADGLGQQSI